MSVFFRNAEKRDADGWTAIDQYRGRIVEPEQAAKLGSVFASIRAIVDYCSTTPVEFFRKNPDGTKTIVPPPPLIQNVETEYTWPVWIGQAAYGIVTRGNAVGQTLMLDNYNGQKPLLVKWALNWSANRYSTMPADWIIDGAGTPDILAVSIPWIVPGGHRLGLSPIEHYASLVQAGLSAQEYADVKRGGGIPPAILKNNMQKLEPTVAAAVQSRAVSSFASGKPFVSGKDWDLNIVSVPPAQAQFIQTMKLTATQIAAIYGIDPREVGGEPANSLTYSNDQSRALNRAHDMRPYLRRLEYGVSKMLPAQTFMRYRIEDTLHSDTETQAGIDDTYLNDGVYSVNEIRARYNLPPVPGGDFHKVPTPIVAPTISKPIAPAQPGDGGEES